MSHTVPSWTAAEWLGVSSVPAHFAIRQIIDLVQARASGVWPGRRVTASLADRRPGDDPRPDLDADFGIIEVHGWRTIVERVHDPVGEIALEALPAPVRANRRVGQPWYETLAHVLLPGANLDTRPPNERGWSTLPRPKS
jgi:hypothetical protein